MPGRVYQVVAAVTVALAAVAANVGAQPLGTFSWQLAPYCNVVTINATQAGAVYTLDGYDDQCGGPGRASATGMAFQNSNGTIGIGLTVVTAPGGTPVHVEATISLATLSGTWHDNHGNTGTFLFSSGGPGSGSPRPLDNALGASDIDPAEVQQRVTGSCPSGQLMTAINENGSVVCDASAGGDITSIGAGTGLGGGGTTGDVELRVLFAGTGTVNAAAKADHTHGIGGATQSNTAVGDSALGINGVGESNTAFGTSALASNTIGDSNTAVGASALANTSANENTAVGANALGAFTVGFHNVALGSDAGALLTTGSNNLYLDNGGQASESATIRIGRAIHTRTFLEGVRNRTTGQNNAVTVVIDNAGQLGTVSSSRRTKTDIEPLSADVAGALQHLRPVQFRYRQAFADGSMPIQYGLIAEEVQDVLPELVALDDDGQPATVKYHVLPSLLLAEVQRLERERQRLEHALSHEVSRVADLERRLDAQARAFDDLREEMSRVPRH